MVNRQQTKLTQYRSKESDDFPLLLVCAFGAEAFFVITLLVWNHNTDHQGGWQDLAVGIGDVFILGGALLYSFLWAITALIKIVLRRWACEPDMRTTIHYRYGIALHCMAILALAIAAEWLLS
ncbi:hypothetical protein AB4Y44_02025 [Paraburkholderia sp. BR10937]|uniref:hypothetical protein n=1 Tax=Paraburkholderia sp. BR10937 TaxID=3236994 RepID=UPI0034D38198